MFRKKLFMLVGFIVLSQFIFSIRCFIPHYSRNDKNEIFYKTSVNGEKILKNVDLNTFKNIDSNFAIDKNHLYFTGEVLNDIDVETFEVVEWWRPEFDPVWGNVCNPSKVLKFKDKNGIYNIEDVKQMLLEL